MAGKKPKQVALTEENPYTSLTIKQRRYVEARMQGLTKHAAARAAGVTDTQSYAYEQAPTVQEAIRYCIRESTKSVEELTKSDVLTGMMDAVAAASTSAELVMAWREIGKLLGVYEPERKVLEVKDYTQHELKQLSDKELLQLAGRQMRDVVDGEFHELTKPEAPSGSGA